VKDLCGQLPDSDGYEMSRWSSRSWALAGLAPIATSATQNFKDLNMLTLWLSGKPELRQSL